MQMRRHILKTLNDAHHWWRASDAQYETETESRRPVHEPGWAVQSRHASESRSFGGWAYDRRIAHKPMHAAELSTAAIHAPSFLTIQNASDSQNAACASQ